MAGLIDTAPSGAIGVEAQGTDMVPSSTGAVLGASAGESFATAFPMFTAGRQAAEMGIDPNSGMMLPEGSFGRTLTPDEATQKYGIPGRLKWSAPVPDSVAQEQAARTHEQIVREDTIARREGGLMTGGAARFAAGLAGGLPGIVDPLNIASAFLPVVPEARAALWAARYGVAGVALTGGLQGAAGQAALTPFQALLAKNDQEDYGAVDAILNIALGGVFGGGLHAGLGRFGRPESRLASEVEHAMPESREALLRGALADMADGNPVATPAAMVDRAGYIVEPESGRLPYSRVPKEPTRLSDYLHREGGLVDDSGELAARELGTRGRSKGGLINPGGMSLDDAALKAWEAGYLPGAERPDINALLAALDQDRNRGPVYSDHDRFAAAEYREALDHNAEIDRLAAEHGVPLRGLTQPQFYDEIARRTGAAAAGVEAERLAASHDAIMARAHEEGWLPDFGEAAPSDNPEELTHAYLAEQADRHADAGPPRIVGSEPVGRAAGLAETGDGSGRRRLGARPGGEPVGEPGRQFRSELTEGEARPPLTRLAEEIAELEQDLKSALPEESEPAAVMRLYRGEGPDNEKGGGWFTTDPTKAALYGRVSYVDVTRDDLRSFAQGHGGPDEWLTDSAAIRARARPVETTLARERPAELTAADELVRDSEALARATEQGGACLGRRL